MTKESLKESIEKQFGSIPDKTVVTRSSHKLVDIVAIANHARASHIGHDRLEYLLFQPMMPFRIRIRDSELLGDGQHQLSNRCDGNSNPDSSVDSE